ncbi:MAG: flotillin family protein, partial [Prevotellaceae bacterium]|jgi:flotillin|nr:flotillin family protein [Prevotellaceae bacterium]
MMISDKLPELVKTQVEAIKNIKIDKITVWDGQGKDGKTSTANFVSGLMKSVPPLSDLFNMAGMQLPEYLGEIKNDTEKTEKAENQEV